MKTGPLARFAAKARAALQSEARGGAEDPAADRFIDAVMRRYLAANRLDWPQALPPAPPELKAELSDESWRQGVEVVGWLYQHFIADRKARTTYAVVPPEELPAATQIFTPRWVARFLVENSLGRLRLEAVRDSRLRAKMRYLLGSAQAAAGGGAAAFDPFALKILDPACGTGHILVEAYRLLREIYLECGVPPRAAARPILERNLFGLDIDARAVRIARFALSVEAGRDDPSLLDPASAPRLNLSALRHSRGLEAAATEPGLPPLLELFREADVIGSLIQVPAALSGRLAELEGACAEEFKPFAAQARVLAGSFDVVAANPPYLGERHMPERLRRLGREVFPDAKIDLFAMFMERSLAWLKPDGLAALVVMESWMFLRRFEALRRRILKGCGISALVHMDKNLMGIAFGTAASVMRRGGADRSGVYTWVGAADLARDGEPVAFPVAAGGDARHGLHAAAGPDFLELPGAVMSYWLAPAPRAAFRRGVPLRERVEIKQGLATGDNERFLRRWWEVDIEEIGFGMGSLAEAKASGKRWFPYGKGGRFRQWYGNHEYVVDWHNDGAAIRALKSAAGRPLSRAQNTRYYFRPGLTWTFLSASRFGVRRCPAGFIFDVAGSMLFPDEERMPLMLGFLASQAAFELLKAVNPTINFQVGNLGALPWLEAGIAARAEEIRAVVEECVAICRADWDERETSWDFARHPLLEESPGASLEDALQSYLGRKARQSARLGELEEENDRIFGEIYGVPPCPRAQNRSAGLEVDRGEAIRSLLSYFVGCACGRYRLDGRGVFWAHSSAAEGGPYFRASEDGRLPLNGDGTGLGRRLHDFLAAIWGAENIANGLRTIADELGSAGGPSEHGIIESYFRGGFMVDHERRYKQRSIYGLESGAAAVYRRWPTAPA